jgi:hypothetical protein
MGNGFHHCPFSFSGGLDVLFFRITLWAYEENMMIAAWLLVTLINAWGFFFNLAMGHFLLAALNFVCLIFCAWRLKMHF